MNTFNEQQVLFVPILTASVKVSPFCRMRANCKEHSFRFVQCTRVCVCVSRFFLVRLDLSWVSLAEDSYLACNWFLGSVNVLLTEKHWRVAAEQVSEQLTAYGNTPGLNQWLDLTQSRGHQPFWQWDQGPNEVRWRPGQEASLTPPCSNLSSFESKCIALKKVLVTLLGFFRARHSHSAPGELCPPCPHRYDPDWDPVHRSRLMRRAASLIHTSEMKGLLNPS